MTGGENLNWFWLFFLGVIVLLSPALKGGETYLTSAWLRLLIIFGSLYFFSGRIKSGRLRFFAPAGNRLLLALLAVFSVSLLTTHYFFVTIYWHTVFFGYLLLFYLALNIFEGEKEGGLVQGLFWVFLAAGLIQSGTGIAEYFFQGRVRASGSFFNPAYYAGYLAGLISFPLAGAVFDLWPGISGRKKILLRPALAAASVIIFFGVLVSASRAIIFLVIPLGLILIVRFRRLGAGALVLLGLALIFIPNPVRDRIKNIDSSPYAWERVTIWNSSLKMIRHHPLGVGLGMYQYYYQRYMSPMRKVKIGRYGREVRQSHNEILNFAAECSAAAPLLGLGFLGLLLLRLLRGLKGSKPSGEDRGRLLAFGGSLLSILAHSLVDFNLHQPPIMTVAVLDLACFLSILSRRDPGLIQSEEYLIGRPGFFRAFIFSVGILISLLIVYQSVVEGMFFQAMKSGNPEQRVTALYRLSRLPSGYAPIYFQLGEEFRKNYTDTAQAELGIQGAKYFQFAADLNPESCHTYFQWADCVYRLGIGIRNINLFTEAGDLCEKAAALGPGQVFSYFLLSNIEYLKKDYEKSEQWLRTALGYEPYFLEARSRLAAILLEQGDFQGGEREFQILLEQKKEVEGLLSKPDSGLSDYQKLLSAADPEELAGIEKTIQAQSIPPLFQDNR